MPPAAEKLLDGPTGTKPGGHAPGFKHIYGLGYSHWGWRGPATIDRKAWRERKKGPQDPGAARPRSSPRPSRRSGAIPVPIDLTEVYLALSQRVAKGAVETPMISLAATKHDEIVNTINMTNQVYNVGIMMASKAKFDALPPDAQKAIRDANVNLTKDWRTTIAAAGDAATQPTRP